MNRPEPELWELLCRSAEVSNILPLTSGCDSHCIFCSHKNNPPEVRTARIGMLDFELVRHLMLRLDPNSEITIGESATRIIEGEPTLHPNFAEIILLLRERFPHTPVSITTNGHRLDEELVCVLERAGNILVNLSLNSASARGRSLLMGDSEEQTEKTLAGVLLLREHKIPFTASMVAMPNVTGWDDIRETVLFLAENGARSVTLFAPSFSSFVETELFPQSEKVLEEIRSFIGTLSEELPCPVLVEPSSAKDLRAELSGVVKDSPAWKLGLRRGDEILAVDGLPPRCRVDAYEMLSRPGRHEVRWKSAQGEKTGELTSLSGLGSGVTMEYDIDPMRMLEIRRAVETAQSRPLLMCSEFAHPVLAAVLDTEKCREKGFDLVPVKNLTFGGSIKCAGLLCVSDYRAAYDAFVRDNPAPRCVAVPGESFDYLGNDLKGEHFNDLQKYLKAAVITL